MNQKEDKHLYMLDGMIVSLTEKQVERGRNFGFHIERVFNEEILV